MTTSTGTPTAGDEQRPPLELLDVDLAVDRGAGPAVASAPRWGSRARAAMLALIVAVVVAAAISMGRGLATAGSAPPAVAPPAAVMGLAELLVATYLTADGPDGQLRLRTLYPAAPEQPDEAAAHRFVSRVIVVDAGPVDIDHWAVTVAAEVLVLVDGAYHPDGLHHYLVGVVETADGPAATSLPVRIPTPPSTDIPAVATGAAVEDDALLALTKGFLDAYGTGSGDLRTFVAAGTELTSITPPPYRSIAIDSVTAVKLGEDRLQLRALGTAVDARRSPVRVEHHLIVVTEGGAWKVLALAPGPPTTAQLEDAAGDLSER